MNTEQIKHELTNYVMSCSMHNRGVILTDMLDLLIGQYPARSTQDNFWKTLLLAREKYRNPSGNYAIDNLEDADVDRVLRQFQQP